MPDCHKCPRNGRPTRACLTCKGPAETNHKGRSHVSLDADSQDSGHGQSWADVDAVIHDARAAGDPAPGQDGDREQAIAFMARLFALDERTFRIVRWRFLHPETPLPVIARRFRLSTQAVHQRLQKLAETWPAVRQLVGLRLKRGPKMRQCAPVPPSA